jgi:hypothetical protein
MGAVGRDLPCGPAQRRYSYAEKWVDTKYSGKAVTGNEHTHTYSSAIRFTSFNCPVPVTDVLSCSDGKGDGDV